LAEVADEVSLARFQQRATEVPDRMEREAIDFYKKLD
jgi:hypothetical protein